MLARVGPGLGGLAGAALYIRRDLQNKKCAIVAGCGTPSSPTYGLPTIDGSVLSCFLQACIRRLTSRFSSSLRVAFWHALDLHADFSWQARKTVLLLDRHADVGKPEQHFFCQDFMLSTACSEEAAVMVCTLLCRRLLARRK